MKSSEDSSADAMSIGALAARFGLATHVLRHWESMGLLHPVRDAGGRRRYGPDDVGRVAVILISKEAGLGLDTIRSLSATVDRTARHEILRSEAEELRARIAADRASLAMIEGGLNCSYEDVTRCPNYRRLIAERAGSRVRERGKGRGCERGRGHGRGHGRVSGVGPAERSSSTGRLGRPPVPDGENQVTRRR